MIVPLVSEEDWLVALRNAHNWVPPAKPTLVISPHPDDETLGAGGLIAYQAAHWLAVTIAAATDGEAAYLDAPGSAAAKRLAAVRRKEQEQAVKQLGPRNTLIRLQLPDSALALHEDDLERLLDPLIQAGMLIIAPWINDWHPDHEACARVARKLCQKKGAELISYVFWTWHRRTEEVFNGAHLLRFELSPASWKARKIAIGCHVSQLKHGGGGEPILPSSLLAPILRPFETFISHV